MAFSAEDVLAGRPARSVEDVIGGMRGLDTALPDNDGVKWFNRLYLRVTEAVVDEIRATGHFNDPAWVDRLDVVFANLYFFALARGNQAPAGAPHAWRPLLESRRAPRIARIQFALAGMNAHINRDLVEALVRTFKEMGGEPEAGTPRHEDYESVNDILARVEQKVKAEFSVGALGHLDRALGEEDDLFAMWSVRAARDAAWTNAEVLWSLPPIEWLRNRYLLNLGRITGFAGRGLLAPRI